MSFGRVNEQASSGSHGLADGAWLATIDLSLDDGSPAAPHDTRFDSFSLKANGQVEFVTQGDLTVVLDGSLRIPNKPPAAEWILAAYREHPRAFPSLLVGPFAVLVWDRATRGVTAARDAVGSRPLAYTRAGTRILFSPSPEALADAVGATELDPIAIANWVARAELPLGRTLYRDIKRVIPNQILSLAETATRTRPVQRVTNGLDEPILDEFSRILDDAVAGGARGRSSTFLSDGMDSLVVASALAAESARRPSGRPLALSVSFELQHLDSRAIELSAEFAEHLGLEFISASLRNEDETLASAARLGATQWLPPPNPWAIQYEALSAAAASNGARSVYSGEGGNDLLDVTVSDLATLCGGGHYLSAARLIRSRATYDQDVGAVNLAKRVSRRLARRMAGRLLPGHAARRRERHVPAPEWLGDGEELRCGLQEEWHSDPPGGPYPEGFDLTSTSLLLENLALSAARHGLLSVTPLLDPELLALCARRRLELVSYGDRFKGVGRAFVERSAGVGVARRARSQASDPVLRSILAQELPPLLSLVGDFGGLRGLGVVGRAPRWAESKQPYFSAELSYYEPWLLISMELWIRAHSGKREGT